MNELREMIERLRTVWDELNDREKRMVGLLGLLFASCLIAYPLFMIAHKNVELEEENAHLRSVIGLIGERRVALQRVAEARKQAAVRYTHHTPPLGTFVEEEAKKHELTIREVTDQPEKVSGSYHRRSVRASINDVGLTGIMDMLSGIEVSQYPVAVDQVQIEHYQAGDVYRFKLGVLTFDKKEGKSSASSDESGPPAPPSQSEPSGG